MKTCRAVDENGPCPDSPAVGDLCSKHYTRHRRTKSFFSRQPRSLGGAHVVSFPVPTEHYEQIASLAKERAVSEASILREAVKVFLDAIEVVRRRANS